MLNRSNGIFRINTMQPFSHKHTSGAATHLSDRRCTYWALCRRLSRRFPNLRHTTSHPFRTDITALTSHSRRPANYHDSTPFDAIINSNQSEFKSNTLHTTQQEKEISSLPQHIRRRLAFADRSQDFAFVVLCHTILYIISSCTRLNNDEHEHQLCASRPRKLGSPQYRVAGTRFYRRRIMSRNTIIHPTVSRNLPPHQSSRWMEIGGTERGETLFVSPLYRAVIQIVGADLSRRQLHSVANRSRCECIREAMQ